MDPFQFCNTKSDSNAVVQFETTLRKQGHNNVIIVHTCRFSSNRIKYSHVWLKIQQPKMYNSCKFYEFQSWQNYQSQIHCQIYCKCMDKLKDMGMHPHMHEQPLSAWSNCLVNTWSVPNANALSNLEYKCIVKCECIISIIECKYIVKCKCIANVI